MAIGDVIPYFGWIVFGVTIVIAAVLLGRFVLGLRGFTAKYRAAKNEEREAEGGFWYIAEVLHILLIIAVIIIAFRFLNYFISAPADNSIYIGILGTWTAPVVALIVLYYIVKIIPHVVNQSMAPRED